MARDFDAHPQRDDIDRDTQPCTDVHTATEGPLWPEAQPLAYAERQHEHLEPPTVGWWYLALEREPRVALMLVCR